MFKDKIDQASLQRLSSMSVATFGTATCGIGFNYARVLGLTGGIGVLSHFINEREKLHSAILGKHVQLESEETQFLNAIQGTLSQAFSDSLIGKV